MRTMVKRRTTEEARDALSRFCKVIGTAGDKSVHIWSIPANPERDADLILSDVITERDELRKQLTDTESRERKRCAKTLCYWCREKPEIPRQEGVAGNAKMVHFDMDDIHPCKAWPLFMDTKKG